MSEQKAPVRYGRNSESRFADIHEAKRAHDETRARLYRALSAWTRGMATIEDLRLHFAALEHSVKLLIESVEHADGKVRSTPAEPQNRLRIVDSPVPHGSLEVRPLKAHPR
jgi:hypothetical protein